MKRHRVFNIKKKYLQNAFCALLALFTLVVYSAPVKAHYCGWYTHVLQDLVGVGTCSCTDVLDQAEPEVIENHEEGETQILAFMRERFHLHREWVVRPFMINQVVQSLMLMTEQMSNVAMYQMFAVGKMYDAKLHLESQRLFNELQNEAAKDYQPSDSFCYFGTNVRSLAHSESLASAQQASLSQIAMARQLGNVNSAPTAGDGSKDRRARWDMFVAQYCDPHDNNWRGGTSGLVAVCNAGAAEAERTNIDVDYGRLIDSTRYLEVNFNDNVATADEQDIISLSKNLYGNDVPEGDIRFMDRSSVQHFYLDLRSVIAKRSVAQNSYNAIVAMKSAGSGGGDSPAFFYALVQDLGMSVEDIEEIFGENPSYYAQLEAVGKKIFQNTDFFTDLQDKPMNVKRKKAALNAIELMLDRAIYESELRHEMILSVLLSSNLEDDKEEDFRNLTSLRN